MNSTPPKVRNNERPDWNRPDTYRYESAVPMECAYLNIVVTVPRSGIESEETLAIRSGRS